METRQIWIRDEMYTVEYPSGLNLDCLSKEADGPTEANPAPAPPIPPAQDEWEERKGLLYTIIQILFAFLILTQGASTLKSVLIGVVLVILGLTQMGYINWSHWLEGAGRLMHPLPIGEQQPMWKTLFLLSINFLISLFPGINDID